MSRVRALVDETDDIVISDITDDDDIEVINEDISVKIVKVLHISKIKSSFISLMPTDLWTNPDLDASFLNLDQCGVTVHLKIV
jgi:hypothetical protein